jgi:uronate dehydrogenase
MGFYKRRDRIGVDEPVRPDSRYGVSKAFGEAVGASFADKFGLRVMSIRIGNVGMKPIDKRRLSIWIHPEDLFQLCRIGLEHPDLHHAIVYGESMNERSWWDNRTAFRLGYAPEHRAEDHAAAALAAQAELAGRPDRRRLPGWHLLLDGIRRRSHAHRQLTGDTSAPAPAGRRSRRQQCNGYRRVGQKASVA